jgi:ketosteroid isomerase-like protein
MSEEPTTPDLEELMRHVLQGSDVDSVLEYFAPDAIYESENLGSRFEGVPAIRSFIEGWFGSYDDYAVRIEDHRNVGNGVTLTVSVARGRPVGSSGYVAFRHATVSVWIEGRITRLMTYTDIDQARAAAERLAQERG